MTAPICFLDTETDGTHPDRNVWEIGLIRRGDDLPERSFHAFVEIDLADANLAGLQIGRFYERHPHGAYLAGKTATRPEPATEADNWIRSGSYLTARAAAEKVAQLTHGAHIVGAVPNFDTELLTRLLRTYGIAPAWHYHLCDVENLAVGYLAGLGNVFTPPWKSDLLSEALGLDPVPADERHTALGDARWVQRIYDAVMEGPAAP